MASRSSSPLARLRELLQRARADGFAGVLANGLGDELRTVWAACGETLGTSVDRARVHGGLAEWDVLAKQQRTEIVALLMRLLATAKPAPERARGRAKAVTTPPAAQLAALGGDVRDVPVDTLPGVGPSTASKLHARGLDTLEDLALLLPSSYVDHRKRSPPSQWKEGECVTFEARVRGVRQGFHGGRFSASMELELAEGEGTTRVGARWFQPTGGLADWAKRGDVRVVGIPRTVQGRWCLVHPQLRTLEAEMPPVGVRYPVVEGVPAATLVKLVRAAVEKVCAADLPDALPESLRRAHALPSLAVALRALHAPGDAVDDAELARLAAGTSRAHQRLAFDELLWVQLALALERRRYRAVPCTVHVDAALDLPTLLRASVPFEPTRAQLRALGELQRDMSSGPPMMRLLQGDVGSGKTAVAFAAALGIARAGGQTAIMAPTEILAEQHHRTLSAWCERAGLKLGLITGNTRAGPRESLVALAAAGNIDVLVGTHALLTADVGFAQLGLVVIDEQHRFGVEQRAQLRSKGEHPHLLVMTATPIPRSVALVAYGELDLTVIDEMPPGRVPPQTELRCGARALAGARQRIADAVKKGAQAFVVCPLVEASAALEVTDVEATAQALRVLMPAHRIGVVHGRMPAREKDAVMQSFRARELDVLVATTVIEVGVDVPEASAILVEHAERFGLAQLHQLRGRVGRGQGASLCVLHTAEAEGSDAAARLKVLAEHADGFAIAEADLSLRGPGEVFGTRQAGAPRLRLPALSGEITRLLVAAREAAEAL
ncbi:MAG TPA: ATP-dependent DNA helicase RecG, partial [Nannocystaceae bacterium]|nr:ATP-dependent DNA helicase RecG [Nannocystaceae bacterium]